ncbi:hypothetical protein MMC10_004729 [Thelotrema lepadinum]|nr:hypothetical protein [Thelotrema lepadinum]
MAPRAFSRPPSAYPRFLFHLIRIAQFLSSAIVMSIVGYFVWWLTYDGYDVPWTFILVSIPSSLLSLILSRLLAVSSYTVLSILITAFFYHTRSLAPKTSIWFTGSSTGLWLLTLGLLSWNLSNLLGATCDLEHWDHSTGIMVCRIYKALESFTVIGTLSTALALALDISTLSTIHRRGAYNTMPLSHTTDTKHKPIITKAGLEGSTTDWSHDMSNENMVAYREPSLEFPEYSHEVRQPYKVSRQMEASRFGYAAPSEQTSYGGGGAL